MINEGSSSQIENLWEQLLSRDNQAILRAFKSLDAYEQPIVLAHLQRMAEEPGWHPEQRTSALAALSAINQVPLKKSNSE